MTERLVDRLADILVRVSSRAEILFVSPQGREWLSRHEGMAVAKGDSLLDLVAPEDHEAVRAALARAQAGGRQSLCLHMLRGDGGRVWMTCRILVVVSVGKHVELLFAAWETRNTPAPSESPDAVFPADAVTGLPMRPQLIRILEELTRDDVAHGTKFALLHLDLDGFQKVNDALGHVEGDRLLTEVGRRITALLRASDRVARSGSDEFALVLPGVHDVESLEQVARKILTALQRPYLLAGSHVHLSASIGVAFFPEHAGDSQQLLKCADIALAGAKAGGRNRWRVYQAGGAAAAGKRVALEEHMYDAIQNGEFELHYQPLWHAGTRRMVGVEALMRWNRPDDGYIPPAEFIPLAESNGLIGFLGTWSLRAACHQVAQWQKVWGRSLRASVNLSPAQFRQGDVVATVTETLRESGLPAECLTLEITEGALMHDPAETEVLLNRLRDLGVKVSVDDFGTGYSSLAYLKRFPLSSLKIDRSFVADLERDANDLAIVSAIIGLSKELGLSVVAEGVESEPQLAILAGKGCDLIQGYLLGRPVSVDELTRKVDGGEWKLET